MDRDNTSTPITDSTETPLFQPSHNRQPSLPPLYPQPQQQQQHSQQREDIGSVDDDDGDSDDCTELDKSLRWLYMSLVFLGYRQTEVLSFGLSWFAFIVAVAIPVIILELNNCSGCDDYQVKEFEYICLVSQACLAIASVICISHHLRKRGIRKFLFVDRDKGHMTRLKDAYIGRVKDSYRKLILCLLPCLILKAVREISRLAVAEDETWRTSTLIVLALLISWTYLNAISMAACILFHVVCSLQLIHFDDYGKHFPGGSDMLVLIEQHMRLRNYLSKISHRFRIYLLLIFFIVTASQVVTLIQITTYSGSITFLNGGDMAVTAILQVIAVILCLHAGTKISHKAQGIASLGTKWHAITTNCSTEGSRSKHSRSLGSLELPSNMGSSPMHISYSESDLESLDSLSISTHGVSTVASYQKRQSFVLYLQTNPGGITIYGWTVDRVLLNTIFFIELSLVLFVLGNTVVFSPGLGRQWLIFFKHAL